ncbi:hypothetical protein FACS1894122_12640 [Alphaproteobacteria bacterium]|nr:hypothetical protein FACS1894122_12640 [Alphaproteobacteria bacterium]
MKIRKSIAICTAAVVVTSSGIAEKAYGMENAPLHAAVNDVVNEVPVQGCDKISYTGEVNAENVPHGHGKLELSCAGEYFYPGAEVSYWKDNPYGWQGKLGMNDAGYEISEIHLIYEGEFVNGMPQGTIKNAGSYFLPEDGKYKLDIHPLHAVNEAPVQRCDGVCYTGKVNSQNIPHGHGKLECHRAGKDCHPGVGKISHWKDSPYDWQGKLGMDDAGYEISEIHLIYEGEFVNGMPQGTIKNASSYYLPRDGKYELNSYWLHRRIRNLDSEL